MMVVIPKMACYHFSMVGELHMVTLCGILICSRFDGFIVINHELFSVTASIEPIEGNVILPFTSSVNEIALFV
jgi:hypothetical protein